MKARKKSEWKMAIREEAKRKVRGPHCDVSTRGDYSRQVEAGLRELRTKMSGRRRKSETHQERAYLSSQQLRPPVRRPHRTAY